jgi:hypothetical protein
MVSEVSLAIEKPTSTFKINPKWMKVEEFVGKIKVVWKHYNGNLQESTQVKFQQNLKEGKKVTRNWVRDKNMKDGRVLKEVEESLEVLYNSGFGYLNEKKKTK